MWCHASCSYRRCYTAEAIVHCRKGWNRCAFLSIEFINYHLCPFLLAGSEVQHLRPSLVLSLQHVFANHPTLKLHTHCLKQRADADWQHYMRKILFVFLVSNLSGGLTCARMLWELIRVSQELLFLIGCSTGSKMKQLVHCGKMMPWDLGVWWVVVSPLSLPEAN